jgi:glycosyltransferase involved in cell wall biosynthesis
MQLPPGIVYAPVVTRLQIAEGLGKRGHSVTLYCSEDTAESPYYRKATGYLSSTWKRKREEVGKDFRGYGIVANSVLYSQLFADAQEGRFDVLLLSNSLLGSSFLPFCTTPTVFTLHDPISTERYQLLSRYTALKNHGYISISDSQRRGNPTLPFIATIHHCIDTAPIPFGDTPEDYCIFFGRIDPTKGVLDSIAAARQANIPLKIIGPVEDPVYAEKVFNEVDGTFVTYQPALSKEELLPVVSKARALLNLIDWEEPFGMTMIESLACGTPVIARNRGSVPEIVIDGEVGFIVPDVTAAAEALLRIGTIDRKRCREYVEEKFNLNNYLDQYEAALSEIALTHTHGH